MSFKISYVVLSLVVLGLSLVIAGPAMSNPERVRRDTDDLIDQAENFWDKTWGGVCMIDSQCNDVISYCYRDSIVAPGECRMVWWFILVLCIVALLLVSAVISCVCCFCRNICCCCCPGNSGYSLARS